MREFLTTFGLIFVAELADKSRFAGLLLVSLFQSPWLIFLGMGLAYAIHEGLAVLMGGQVSFWIDAKWIQIATGFFFVATGILALRFRNEVEEISQKLLMRFKKWGPFGLSFLAILISEFGDRTQLACVALTAETKKPGVVFLGSMSALVLLNFFTVILGKQISRKIPFKTLHVVGGGLFILFGLFLLIKELL